MYTHHSTFANGAVIRWAGSGDTVGRNNQSSAHAEANINSVFTLAESPVGVLERGEKSVNHAGVEPHVSGTGQLRAAAGNHQLARIS